MTKRLTPLIAIAVIVVAVFVTAYVVVDWENSGKPNEYSYAECEGGYEITGEKLIFHSEYDFPSTYEGKPVVAIADGAFKGCTNITSVRMPDSIVRIGNGAFEGCTGLTDVVLSEKMTSLPKDVFKGCTGIVKIVIPDSVVSLGDSAFDGCSKLSTVVYKGSSNNIFFDGVLFGPITEMLIGIDAFRGTDILAAVFDNSTDGDTYVDACFTHVSEGMKKISVSAAVNDSTDMIGYTEFVPIDGKTVSLNFGNYGLFDEIVITAYAADDTKISEYNVGGISVTADHYNIAYLNGSYPVLLFSLYLCHDTGTALNIDPTFIYLERSSAYDWKYLPNNAYMFPFMTYDDTAKGELGFHEAREGTAQYIKQLYELNNSSTFTLYCVDNYPELILQYLAGNGIPESNWSASLLTDGSGTASLLCETFGGTDPDSIYDTLASEWSQLLTATYSEGYSSDLVLQYAHLASGEYQLLENYPFVIAKEQSNTEWTTGRLRATENLTSIDPDFVVKIRAVAHEVYTNNLLAMLTEDEQVAFKSLYHFSDEMFKEARESGKKIMIILGTSAGGEGLVDTPGDQSEFYNYVKMTMEYYGDGYAYYYKGHPGYPTSLYPHRQEALNALAEDGYTLYELDNSIAAEVILFYNPDVYMSGWQSTTFASVESQEMACSLFNVLKDTFSQTYKPMIDMFMSKLSESPDSSIVLDPSKVYYLIEYNNTAEYPSQVEEYNKHEIAVYNSTDDVFKYYKWDTDHYNEVDR